MYKEAHYKIIFNSRPTSPPQTADACGCCLWSTVELEVISLLWLLNVEIIYEFDNRLQWPKLSSLNNKYSPVYKPKRSNFENKYRKYWIICLVTYTSVGMSLGMHIVTVEWCSHQTNAKNGDSMTPNQVKELAKQTAHSCMIYKPQQEAVELTTFFKMRVCLRWFLRNHHS